MKFFFSHEAIKICLTECRSTMHSRESLARAEEKTRNVHVSVIGVILEQTSLTQSYEDRTVTSDDADVIATKQLACFGASRDVIYRRAGIDRERLKDV